MLKWDSHLKGEKKQNFKSESDKPNQRGCKSPMWLLPPHFWPIIYLWTMVGLSCRPAHKLLWQRLKGKHLLGRLLPPWGCRKDRGNVNRDKDRRTHRHQKGFNEDRGQVGVWWPGRVLECTCFTIKASAWKNWITVVFWRLVCRIQSFLRPGQEKDLSFPHTWYITLSLSVLYPGAGRGGGKTGSDIKDPPRCQMGPQLPPHFVI